MASKRNYSSMDLLALAWMVFGLGLFDGSIAVIYWIRGKALFEHNHLIMVLSFLLQIVFVLPSILLHMRFNRDR